MQLLGMILRLDPRRYKQSQSEVKIVIVNLIIIIAGLDHPHQIRALKVLVQRLHLDLRGSSQIPQVNQQRGARKMMR